MRPISYRTVQVPPCQYSEGSGEARPGLQLYRVGNTEIDSGFETAIVPDLESVLESEDRLMVEDE